MTMKQCDFVIFGTLGDLSRRKLLPSLYQLEKAELIAPETTIVGVAKARQRNIPGQIINRRRP